MSTYRHLLARRKRVWAAVVGAVVVATAITLLIPRTHSAAAHVAPGPRTVVLTLENRSYHQIIGNPAAPYLNHLAHRSALATRFYAIQHPSLPNYLALTTGSTQGVHLDCPHCHVGHTSLFRQLDHAGVAWKAYYESLPPNWQHTEQSPHYRPGMNPFAHLSDVQASRADQARVTGFDGLTRDLAHGALPQFTWITPNTHDDGHTGAVSRLDHFAADLVPQLVKAAGPRGVVYITWDEGARGDTNGVRGTTGGGHTALIATGGLARPHGRERTPANQYALLRTIEASYGLAPLGHAHAHSTPLLRGLLRSR
jgi:hypothetical protein